MLSRLFLDHPRAVGESYGTHFRHAASFGVNLIAAGAVCLVHALVPGFFVTTGSRMVTALYERMSPRRAKALRPGWSRKTPAQEDIGYWVI